MSGCDIITLSSDEENSPLFQDKSPLKQVTGKLESSNKLERRQTTDDDIHHTNKPRKRIHPVHLSGELKVEKESEAKFCMQNLKLLPNESEEHGNKTVFEKFLKLCWQNNKSPEMEKILQKARIYYLKTKPAYVSSQEFQDLVMCKMDAIIKGPSNIYVYIKDVVDEMKIRRLKQHGPPSKIQKTSNDPFVSCGNLNVMGRETSSHAKEEDKGIAGRDDLSTLMNCVESRYTDRKIKKLSKAVEKLHKRIVKLEEKEVDFDEENDSAFIRLERYKDRFCKVYQKLCELTGDSVGYKANRRRIVFSGTRSSEINRCIEKFVNKTGQFPDFHDILSLVKTVQTDVNMRPENLRCIAEDAFLLVGKQLQKQRQYESWDSVSVFLKDQADPAESDPDLQSKLQTNYKEYSSRIQNVIDSFAEKQVIDKLEAEEVADDYVNKSEESGSNDDEEEEEKDFVDKVLRGEGKFSSDEDTKSEKHEENGKSGKDDCKSSHVLPDQEVDILEQTSNHVHLQDHQAAHTQNYSRPPSVKDILQSRRLGPVSPPVLGEDLSKHEFYYVELPSIKDNTTYEENASSPSDTKCRLPSSHFNQHDSLVSESLSPPLSLMLHSEQYKNSVSESLTMPDLINCDDVSHHPEQENTLKIDSSLSTAIQEHAHLQSSYLQQCKKLKPELSSASVAESDDDSSPSHSKQCDIPKSQASLPTFSIEDNADEEDRTSPSLLHPDTCDFDSIAENSDTVTIIPSNINFDRKKSNGKHNSDICVHTTAERNVIISKFGVTEMKVKSDTNSVIAHTDGKVEPRVRKFVRKVGSPCHKQKRKSMKPVAPDVITLE
ncbi:death domain-associated protein 6 isoform X2 [Zootermopsis nevadensis]|uniref:death domain-associated protein 6 isoform X2 n=1 Tax=Zootermopsis nevadensis TaxID=136037 RepID=UPI000B8E4D68|nr:death domain-associated protein 6 isoform X2 [Zootermopsis nevadensis]